MRVPILLVAALGFAATGLLLHAAPGDDSGVRALLFGGPAETLCLTVDDQDFVNGALGHDALLPGIVVEGVVVLTHCDPTPEEILDLDIGFTPDVVDIGKKADPDLGDLLLVASLAYGEDDLLRTQPARPGDRNVVLEIDAHPLRGNGDGNVSLRELRAGINDLPAPGPKEAPTEFRLGLTLVEQGGNELQGDEASLDLRFFLTDRANADLN